jgi:hypothetical protein
MKNGAIIRAALVVILSAFALSQPASAQNALGGPKKPTAVGGAAKQNSPVVPANKAGANVVSPPPKCATCGVKGHK